MRAGLQFVLPVDNNFLPGLQAIVDQSQACLRLRNFNPTHLHALVWLDDVSIGPLRSTLHHVRRNNGRILRVVKTKRAFTNFPGQSLRSLFGNVAFNFTVPVV